MSEPRRIVAVAAGLSEPSTTTMLAERLGRAAVRGLESAGIPATFELIQLRPLARDIAAHMLTRVPSVEMEAAISSVITADGIVAVTPTFNASYSGLFKSFWDVIEVGAVEDIPMLLAATGGTARHSLVIDTAMRPMFAYLKAAPIATGVYAASEDWGSDETGLAKRIERTGAELGRAVANRPVRVLHDEFDTADAEFQSFEQLLGGLA